MVRPKSWEGCGDRSCSGVASVVEEELIKLLWLSDAAMDDSFGASGRRNFVEATTSGVCVVLVSVVAVVKMSSSGGVLRSRHSTLPCGP